MNKHLMIAFALPSVLFYQSNAPILYSDHLLMNQIKTELKIREFDLAVSGNELIVFNDSIASSESENHTASSNQENSKHFLADTEGKEASVEAEGKSPEEFSVEVKRELNFFSTIEQKFVDLPTHLSASEEGDSELVRMLANMSGTIFYGIKLTTVNREDYIFF